MFLRTCVLALTVLGTTVSAFGQSTFTASLQAAAAQTATQPAPESVRRLSIDEPVNLPLEQNLGIRIQRIDPQIQDVGIAQARSFWAPNLQTNLSKNSQTQQPTSSLAGGATNILNSNINTAVGVNQTLPWGAQYAAT